MLFINEYVKLHLRHDFAQVACFCQGVELVRFYFHLRTHEGLEADEYGIECGDVHAAYLQACRGIPDVAAQFLAAGRDPIGYRFEIASEDGAVVMEVPFDELLRPSTAAPPLHPVVRSRRTLIQAARRYKPVLEDAPFGAVILTPDMEYVSVNRAITSLTGETDETTAGYNLEEEEIRSRDPGNTVIRAIASLGIVRQAKLGIRDRRIYWGRMPGSAHRPELTLSYWPMFEEGLLVALGVRVEPSRRLAQG